MTGDLPDANRRLLNHLRDRVEALEEENETLRDRVADLQRVVAPAEGSLTYDQLTREQKVFRVRTALVRDAAKANGRAAMKYGEIQSLFGNRPSPGHAYDLMEHAAEAAGFGIDETADQKRLTVQTESVNDETVIRAANNSADATPA